ELIDRTLHTNSFLQPTKQPVKHRLAILFIDRFRQRYSHGTDLNALLGIAAVGDAVFAHDSFQALVARHSTRGVHVEETHLRNRLWADVMIFVVLRAGFQATTAGHAT